MQVVKRVELDAGLNGPGDTHAAKKITEYIYKGGRFDTTTGGFAGFLETVVTTYEKKGTVTSGRVTSRSFYSNTVVGRAPQLNEQWTFTTVANGQQSLERTSLAWSTRHVGPTYFRNATSRAQRTYQFMQSIGCQLVADCLELITPSAFDAKATRHTAPSPSRTWSWTTSQASRKA
jgi:hypothetical protein